MQSSKKSVAKQPNQIQAIEDSTPIIRKEFFKVIPIYQHITTAFTTASTADTTCSSPSTFLFF